MSAPRKRVIDTIDRPWAARRLYQRFLGPYLLHPQTGIYFSSDATAEQKKLLVATFGRLPEQYQQLAAEYALTLSFCEFATANGNSSTFYADFRQSDRRKISPHIEMSQSSLSPQLVHAHLTHELSHLWWRNLAEQARQRYRRFLAETCNDGTIEVTRYAHDYFLHYLEEPAGNDAVSSARRQNSLQSWCEESFCESVAVLECPQYPHRLKNTTVDLKLRSRKVEELTGLRRT